MTNDIQKNTVEKAFDYLSNNIGTFSISIIGILFTAFIAHLFFKRQFKWQRFIKASCQFRDAILPAKVRIEAGEHSITVVKSEFWRHSEAMMKFIAHLNSKTRIAFDKDWQKYKHWHDDIVCRPIEKQFWPSEGKDIYEQQRQRNACHFFNKLLAYTKIK